MNKSKALKTYQNAEMLNTVSHGLGAFAAVVGLIYLLFLASNQGNWSIVSALIYGVSMFFLYAASTLYHDARDKKRKKLFKIADHCGIYLLIAGTYTPVALLVLPSELGWMYFGIQWGMALLGVVLKLFFTGRFKLFSTLLYAFMGWMIAFHIDVVQELLSETAFDLLAAGGIFYTVGIVFYLLDKRFAMAHFIWHLFVLAGSIAHFALMAGFVFR